MDAATTMTLEAVASDTKPLKSDLKFLKRDSLWDHEKPYRMRYMPIGGVPKTNFLVETYPVDIYNLRPAIPTLALDTNGFEMHKLASDLNYTDFFDLDKVHAVYMKEVQELAKKVCKAKHAHPLDYELRRRHEMFPISTGENYAFGQPNSLSHIDITLEGINDIVRQVYGEHANEILKSRVRCVTVWKPLKGPVLDWPLALCDSRSLKDADIVPADAVYERVVTENCMIHHNPAQAWYYLADQQPSEALIFKATDSNSALFSRCAHGSFHLPGILSGFPRESIDVRV